MASMCSASTTRSVAPTRLAAFAAERNTGTASAGLPAELRSRAPRGVAQPASLQEHPGADDALEVTDRVQGRVRLAEAPLQSLGAGDLGDELRPVVGRPRGLGCRGCEVDLGPRGVREVPEQPDLFRWRPDLLRWRPDLLRWRPDRSHLHAPV